MEQQQQKDNSNIDPRIEEIQRRVRESAIHISEAGKETKTRFKKLANTNFGGHYGYTLAHLLDFRDAMISTSGGEAWEAIDAITKRLMDIESEIVTFKNLLGDVEESKGPRNMLGKPIERGVRK